MKINKDTVKELCKKITDATIDQMTEDYQKANQDHKKDRKSTRLNSSHIPLSRMPSSA